ncbi:MAG TPA: hypothetical protein VGN17_12045 [Bryobacteraceae bacterium]
MRSLRPAVPADSAPELLWGDRFRPLAQRIFGWNERVPLLVLATWAWLYLPRPFHLGFYHDDWWSFVEASHGSAPFSWQRLSHFVGSQTPFASRPLGGFLCFLLNSIGGTSPFRYHACGAVLVLLAAFSLRAWFREMLSAADAPARGIASDIAVAFWVTVPWSFAGTAWPTTVISAVPAQIFFTEAFRQILPPRAIDRRHLTLFGIGLTASYLTYESFYFQFALVALFYLIFQRHIFKNWSTRLWFLGIGAGTQVLALGINRYYAGVSPAVSKKFNPEWWTLFRQSLLNLPNQMLLRMGENARLWAGLVLLLSAASLLLLVVGFALRSRREATASALGLLLVGAFAIPITIFTYSVASYAVNAVGLQSRTFFPVSWALTMMVLGGVWLLLQMRWKGVGVLLLAVPLGIVYLDGIAQRSVLDEMAYVWNQEQDVLAHAPVKALRDLPADSRILFVGPAYYDGIAVFAADWDVTGAVYSVPGLSEGRAAFQRLGQIHSATTLYQWSWDGKNLVQNLPGYWKETRPAAHMFLWNYDGNRFYEVEPGFHWPATP